MNQRYELIISKIQEARQTENKRQLKLWRNKLEKWQQEYGAYSPIR
jgi:hypothetical protein